MTSYDEGYEARCVGKSIDENPYAEKAKTELETGLDSLITGTELDLLEWRDGWNDADREFCSGTRTIGY